MIQIKIHTSYRDVIAICDTELIGKTFEEQDRELNLKENFYKGEEFDEEKAISLIQNMKIEDATFNIVGKEATQTAIKAGIIKPEEIKTIQDIPYALVLL